MEIKKRIVWIDCAKMVAICAVVLDHSYGTLYSNSILGKLTYFSVGLFVLLLGVSSFISLDNKIDAGGTKREIYLINTYRRIVSFLKEYAFATLIIYVI